MKRLTGIFLRGVVTLFPVALTLYVAWWLLVTVEESLGRLVPAGWYFPGMGWLLAVLVIFAVGVLMQVFLFERLVDWAVSLFDRIPLLRTVFNTFRDLFSFLGERDDRELSTVVRLRLEPDVSLIGFVTNTAVDRELPESARDRELIAVYLPMSYQVGGYTLLVPRDRVEALDMNAEEAMKLVLTAGLKRR